MNLIQLEAIQHCHSTLIFAAMWVLATSLWQRLDEMDRHLFTLINGQWTNSLFDAVMPFLRTPMYWAPLYLFMLVFVLLNFRLKGAWWAILFLSTTAITDLSGNYLFKKTFERLRPCNDPELYSQVRLLVDNCGSGYSFVSNHAANHFGMAIFFILTFRQTLGRWTWLALLWAASIAYAQVYVGVHYPLDVLTGALLGTIAGLATATLFNKQFRFVNFDNQPTL